MAGLTPNESELTPWTAAQSRAQFAALAKLRWCIFRNAFRRKGGVGEVVARIIIFPLLGFIAIVPIVGSGVGAYFIISSGHIAMLPLLTWGIFLLWQLVVLNVTPPGLSFDINTIIRFPLSFPRYLTARVFFGLLSASTVIGTLCLISADIGIIIAQPSLALWSTLLLAIFALTNIFFTRMIMVWVDRWLSTRRAREIFTAFILFASLGFQYINLNFNPGMQGRHHRHLSSHLPLFRSIYHHVKPIAAFLPPGLTAASIVSYSQSHVFAAIASLFGLIAFGALFFSVYAWRMHREFRGENLSETTQSNQPQAQRSIATAPRPAIVPNTSGIATRPSTFGLNATVIACLQKEFIYLRRNINQLYGFVVPIFMVFLLAGRMTASERFGDYVFPVAIAYSILGVSILSYNALGMDGAGVQFYFLSPTRLRDVFLAKNLMGFLLNLIELVLIFAVISHRRPSSTLYHCSRHNLLASLRHIHQRGRRQSPLSQRSQEDRPLEDQPQAGLTAQRPHRPRHPRCMRGNRLHRSPSVQQPQPPLAHDPDLRHPRPHQLHRLPAGPQPPRRHSPRPPRRPGRRTLQSLETAATVQTIEFNSFYTKHISREGRGAPVAGAQLQIQQPLCTRKSVPPTLSYTGSLHKD